MKAIWMDQVMIVGIGRELVDRLRHQMPDGIQIFPIGPMIAPTFVIKDIFHAGTTP
jgi:hypothetical protein